jgi:lipoate-protein ligase A
MKYLDLTFDDAARNLACDEALLELAEAQQLNDSLLRVWESANYFVVLGHSNPMSSEINVAACEANGISILRRMSGGGTVMQGPGCLNYSLILTSTTHRLSSIGGDFHYVLERHRNLIAQLAGVAARIDGISDLTVKGRKFSGNAQYRKSRAVLIHGTFLLGFDLSLIDRYLHLPAKQPLYRRGRPHAAFLANLDLASDAVCDSLREVWLAGEVFSEVPLKRIEALVRERYGQDAWSKKF